MDARPWSGGAGTGLGLIAVLLIVGFLVLRPRAPDPIPPVPSSTPSAVAIATEPATPDRTPLPTPEPTPEPTPTIEPIAAVADDGVFRLEIAAESPVVAADQPINIAVWLTYVGPAAVVQYGHGDPAVSFLIQQLDGPEGVRGLVADVCQVDRQARGDRLAVRFVKSGEVRGIFDEAWYRDPQLHLPPGRWQIVAALEAYIPECGLDADIHRNRAGVTVTVTP